MTAIQSITLEAPDTAAAASFYASAFDLGDRIAVRDSSAPTSGFRSYSLSLVVAQPGTVDSLIGTAIQAGAAVLKPVKKSFWGYGGTVQAPDGVIWKVATSAKKHKGPVTREIDDLVLLLGVADVKATKRFYEARGLPVAKSFGSKYVQFDAPEGHSKLALYGHDALAKDVGVAPQGSGSHRIAIGIDAEPFTDPDGFAWETAPVLSAR